MKTESENGANIVVFPEGWSNFSDSYLLDFQKGAFKVAIDGQLPMVVCTMIHTHELFPKPKIQLNPGVAHVFWEKIVSTEGMTFENDFENLKKEIAGVFLERLKKHYPNGYHYPRNQMDFETWKAKMLSKKTS